MNIQQLNEELENIFEIDKAKSNTSCRKRLNEKHSYSSSEEKENKFVQLYKKCYEYKKQHPEMEILDVLSKLCFNTSEGWVNMNDIVKTWCDMFIYDGTNNDGLIEELRQDIIDLLNEYLTEDEQDGDFGNEE